MFWFWSNKYFHDKTMIYNFLDCNEASNKETLFYIPLFKLIKMNLATTQKLLWQRENCFPYSLLRQQIGA